MRAATNRRHGARRTALNYTSLPRGLRRGRARSRRRSGLRELPGGTVFTPMKTSATASTTSTATKTDTPILRSLGRIAERAGRQIRVLSFRRTVAPPDSGLSTFRVPARETVATAGRSATSHSAAQGTGIFALTGSEGQAGRTGVAGSFPPADRRSVSDSRFPGAPRRRVASCRLEPSSSSSRQWRYQPTKQPS